MPWIKRAARCCVVMLGLGAISTANGQQDYPTKPVLFVIPFAAGGDSDLSGRNVGQHATKHMNNRPIVALNRVGASGVIGAMSVKNATPMDTRCWWRASLRTRCCPPPIASCRTSGTSSA